MIKRRTNLKIARVKKNMSQKSLAEMAEVTAQAISDMERGLYNPSFETMKKISEILEESVDLLFFQGEEEREVI